MTIQSRAEFSEVSVDIVDGQTLQVTMREPEPRARIDWTIIAPDR